MPKIVPLIVKISLGIIAAIIILDLAFGTGMSYYDAHTRDALLRVVAQELPPRASDAQMADFMQRHTTRYAFDDKYHHEFAGFVPQTQLDQFLFDRKVRVALKVNEDRTFREAEIQVFYTFL